MKILTPILVIIAVAVAVVVVGYAYDHFNNQTSVQSDLSTSQSTQNTNGSTVAGMTAQSASSVYYTGNSNDNLINDNSNMPDGLIQVTSADCDSGCGRYSKYPAESSYCQQICGFNATGQQQNSNKK